jgi:nicotinamidase-related amidase
MTVKPLQPATTALVLVDLQRGIIGMGAQPHEAADVVANSMRLAEKFRELGSPVFLTHVVASPDGADRLRPDADEAMQMRDVPADFSVIVPELGPKAGDIVIDKRQWGAFFGTPLDLQLRRRGIRTIVLGGISTNYGVESTARDAYERSYDLVFAEDAMSARSAEDHQFAVARIFPRIGRVGSTDDVLVALQG